MEKNVIYTLINYTIVTIKIQSKNFMSLLLMLLCLLNISINYATSFQLFMTNGLKGPWTQEEEYFKEQLNNMSKLPENQECADCTSKAPRWSVYNHGIFVCIKCSGQHRNLGTGISKVRSINMDRWRQD